MTEPLLKLQNVKKVIHKQTIVQSINIDLQQGQVLALCGGNGAGKSTILRMVAGIMHPTEGTITLGGLQWNKDRKKYANLIGYMPDDYQFGHGLTAFETLAFWAALRNMTQERVKELIDLVGLTEAQHKSVRSFSKGMRQRLLFAQALIARPALLIMDEPTNGLDPYWMDTFVQLIQTIKKQGYTVIFSTHQLQVAESVADQVIFLREGNIVKQGSTESFRSQYGPLGLNGAFSELFGLA